MAACSAVILETCPPEPELDSCGICRKRLHNGVFTPCMHAFCSSCLQKQLGSGKDEATCPCCREHFNIPGGDVSQLRSTKVLELWTQRQEILKGKIPQCQICEQRCLRAAAEVRCVDCSAFYCSSCFTANHSVLAALRCHKGTDIPADCTAEWLADLIQQNSEMCAVHSGQREESVCTRCGVAVCSLCPTTAHSGHELKKIDGCFSKQALDAAASSMVHVRSESEALVQERDELVAGAGAAEQEALDAIQEQEKELAAALKETSEQDQQEVKSKFVAYRAELAETVSQAKRRASSTKRLQDMKQAFDEMGSKTDHTLLLHRMQRPEAALKQPPQPEVKIDLMEELHAK